MWYSFSDIFQHRVSYPSPRTLGHVPPGTWMAVVSLSLWKLLETAGDLGILGTSLTSVVEPFHQTGEYVASYFPVRK